MIGGQVGRPDSGRGRFPFGGRSSWKYRGVFQSLGAPALNSNAEAED